MKKENGIGIIALTIIVTVIISALIYFIEKNKPEQAEPDLSDNKIYKVSESYEKFDDVKDIVEDYINTIIKKDGKKLTNILRPLYKKQFRVLEENIAEDLYTKLNLYGNEFDLVINEMYEYKNSEDMGVFFVYGDILNDASYEKTELKVMVELNSKTRHYTITPNDGVSKWGYDNVNESSFMNISNMQIIENEYNVY